MSLAIIGRGRICFSNNPISPGSNKGGRVVVVEALRLTTTTTAGQERDGAECLGGGGGAPAHRHSWGSWCAGEMLLYF